MATFAPSSASASAMARPMRLAAPVTSAVLPASGLFMLELRRGGCRLRELGSDRLLHTGLAFGSLAAIVFVRGDLLLRAQHLDGGLLGRLVDVVALAERGKPAGDDLNQNLASGGDDIDDRLAFGIGLDLEIAKVLAVPRRVEDDARVRN